MNVVVLVEYLFRFYFVIVSQEKIALVLPKQSWVWFFGIRLVSWFRFVWLLGKGMREDVEVQKLKVEDFMILLILVSFVYSAKLSS